MHPVENIRGSLSSHLEGRRIVLAVSGSIAAVKAVELARELIRHGADVIPVMSSAATRILHPDALEFATGNKPITQLSGAVEHVSLLGDVAGKADLLLVAPATANTIAKMALGIDDGPVTTCATVAFGSGVPVVVAPAMHEAMLNHTAIAQRQAELHMMGVTWVDPSHDEKKAKLADVDAIVEAVIHRVASATQAPLAGKRALVVSGSTAEPIDPVRILSNRSSGRSGHIIATELRRLGAEVTLWQGHASEAVPSHLENATKRFATHADLMRLVGKADLAKVDQVWMVAAIGDYASQPAKEKIASEQKSLRLELTPLPKVIEAVRKKAPRAILVAFKAESDPKRLLAAARSRLKRYDAQFVVANPGTSFGSDDTVAHLVYPKGAKRFTGPKAEVLPTIVALVALSSAGRVAKPVVDKRATKAAPKSTGKAPVGRKARSSRAKPRTGKK